MRTDFGAYQSDVKIITIFLTGNKRIAFGFYVGYFLKDIRTIPVLRFNARASG